MENGKQPPKSEPKKFYNNFFVDDVHGYNLPNQLSTLRVLDTFNVSYTQSLQHSNSTCLVLTIDSKASKQ
jgi:hypothetical protein